jgi:small subunit ribosomal protein S8
MAMNDTLAAALNDIFNAGKIGKAVCRVKPVSKVTTAILDIMKAHKYIGEYTVIDDGRGGIIEITLIGAINKCGVIKPRFSIAKDNFDKFEKRYLPSKDFGLMIISTSQGILAQAQAKEKNIGGVLLAYVY